MRSDRITAPALLGVSLFAFVESGRYGPLSRLFPRVVAVVLGVLSLLLLVQSFLHLRDDAASDPQPEPAGDRRGMFVSLLVMVGWVLLLEPAGFWISSVLSFSLLVVVLHVPGKAVLWKNLVVAAVLVTVFVLLFRVALRVPLPEGLVW